jgi:predicted dehydrogenase
MINAAIVGMGRWGQVLVDSVQGKSDKIKFIHGVTRTPAKVEDFCSERGIALGDDYPAMLADPAVDAVVLASPHSVHFDQMMAAAAAGKHIFCEKPFALTKADANAALAAISTAGLKVGLGHNRRFAPNTVELKRMLDAGELGETLMIEGSFSAPMARYVDEWRTSRAESPAGGMTSLGIHSLDLFIHLFGRISEVQARSKRQAMPFDVDDTTAIMLSFEDGRMGYISCIANTAMLWYARVFGTKGWVEIRDQDKLELCMTDGTQDARNWAGYDYPGVATLTAELEAFADDIAGGAPFAITPDEMLHNAAVLEAIIESAEGTGESVQVG